MPYCPECGYEYTAGTKTCPDCQKALVQSEQVFCDACEEPISPNVRFCPHCGILLGGADEGRDNVRCETHPDAEAVGACVMCGKPVCHACAVRKQGKVFCTNDEHVTMAFDWAAVCSTSTEYEAEMIRANLEGAGIQALVFSQSDRVFPSMVGDLAVNQVMVPKSSLSEAQRFLRGLTRGGPSFPPKL